jgi:hypothetical protein
MQVSQRAIQKLVSKLYIQLNKPVRVAVVEMGAQIPFRQVALHRF